MTRDLEYMKPAKALGNEMCMSVKGFVQVLLLHVDDGEPTYQLHLHLDLDLERSSIHCIMGQQH